MTGGVRLTSPYSGAAIEVSDDLVDRYVAAGWEKATSKAAEPEPKKAPAKSSQGKK